MLGRWLSNIRVRYKIGEEAIVTTRPSMSWWQRIMLEKKKSILWIINKNCNAIDNTNSI